MKYTQLIFATFATLALAAPQSDFMPGDVMTVKQVVKDADGGVSCTEANSNQNELSCSSTRDTNDGLTPLCEVKGCTCTKGFRDFAASSFHPESRTISLTSRSIIATLYVQIPVLKSDRTTLRWDICAQRLMLYPGRDGWTGGKLSFSWNGK
ncbi:uncharacterized protein G6M90_00g081690 [Metarhizium brunneum]|uniref:Uncharacterized protein n=1 Tax=Metarhizium brunneum TaxID=500148 RepID=A0A7D5V1P2_9HYPO|nr:hypothetical protein G6M90_00g081690 [Metarhizium brunneum]